MTLTGVGGYDRNTIVAQVEGAETLGDIKAVMKALSQRFGFAYFKVYVTDPVMNGPLRDQLTMHNFPEDAIDRFEASGIKFCLPQLQEKPADVVFQLGPDDLLLGAEPERRAELKLLMDKIDVTRAVYVAVNGLKGPERVLSFYGDPNELNRAAMEEICFLGVQVIHRLREIDRRDGWGTDRLSALEIRCLEIASEGGDSERIARELSLSVRTIRYLVNALCQKLGVERLEQAVCEALRRGYIV